MSCVPCKNTTLDIIRQTRTITAGKLVTAEATVQSSIGAYSEPIATDFSESALGRKGARRMMFVVEDTDIEPEDSIVDLGDNNRPYAITDFLRFRGSHIELRGEEIHYGD